jgi:amino acid transporter
MARLSRSELLAMAGGLLLAGGLFAPWYDLVSRLASLAGFDGLGSHSAWQAHAILRWLLLVIAIAPFVLAYIIVRDHELSWARGELTAVLAILAVGLVLYVGVIDRPGEPPGQIELAWGWYVALLGSVLMLVGAARRTTETERRRKPPGTI